MWMLAMILAVPIGIWLGTLLYFTAAEVIGMCGEYVQHRRVR